MLLINVAKGAIAEQNPTNLGNLVYSERPFAVYGIFRVGGKIIGTSKFSDWGTAGHVYDGHMWRAYYESTGQVRKATVPPRHAKNVRIRGYKHEVTDVVFDVRGYSIFEFGKHHVGEVRIAKDVINTRNSRAQMKAATEQLNKAIERSQIDASIFRVDQLQAIKEGNPKIPGFVWHHHQERGRMQLVDVDIHEAVGHSGGMSIWYAD